VCDNYYFCPLIRTSKYRYAPARPLEAGYRPYTNMETHWPCTWKVALSHTFWTWGWPRRLERIISWTNLVNLWWTSCEHQYRYAHQPCANMETHWPVHLKRDTRPTHFEREAGQYGPSVSRPIRSEMRQPRFAGTSERANVHYRQDAPSVNIWLNHVSKGHVCYALKLESMWNRLASRQFLQFGTAKAVPRLGCSPPQGLAHHLAHRATYLLSKYVHTPALKCSRYLSSPVSEWIRQPKIRRCQRLYWCQLVMRFMTHAKKSSGVSPLPDLWKDSISANIQRSHLRVLTNGRLLARFIANAKNRADWCTLPKFQGKY